MTNKKDLESMLWNLFNKEEISETDVIISRILFKQWKKLTNWQSDNTPALMSCSIRTTRQVNLPANINKNNRVIQPVKTKKR